MKTMPLQCTPVDGQTVNVLTNLCMEFFWRVDHGFADHTEQMFTDDVFYSAQGCVSQGKNALMERMRERAGLRTRISRHVASGFRFHQLDADLVLGCWLLVVYRNGPVPAVVADVNDLFRCESTGWRVAERHIVPVAQAKAFPAIERHA